MKHLSLAIILTLSLFKPTTSASQENEIALAVGAAFAIGGAIASVNQAEEQLELKATQWILGNMDIKKFNVDGDSYIVSDYVDEFKYLYNEKALGMFHIKTNRLFQVRSKSIMEIHEFLLRKTPITL